MTLEGGLSSTKSTSPDTKYHYAINVGGRAGEATLIVKTVHDFVGDPEAHTFLKEGWLRDSDKVAVINEFYPNGRGLDEEKEEKMREGIGSRVLEKIIADAIHEGARAVFVTTGTASMSQFLKKHGFLTIREHAYMKTIR